MQGILPCNGSREANASLRSSQYKLIMQTPNPMAILDNRAPRKTISRTPVSYCDNPGVWAQRNAGRYEWEDGLAAVAHSFTTARTGDETLQCVRLANQMARRLCYVLELCRKKNTDYIVEQPSTSMLFQYKCVRELWLQFASRL